MSKVEHVLTAQDELGECPLWDSAGQALCWVDMEGCRVVHRYQPATNCQEIRQPGFPMTAFGFRASGGWVAVAKNGLGFSPAGKTFYFVGMFHGKILAYDHDPATGAVENRRIFALAPEEAGFPDGIAERDATSLLGKLQTKGGSIEKIYVQMCPDKRVCPRF